MGINYIIKDTTNMNRRNPWNKGTKGICKPNSGSFVKGRISYSYWKGKKNLEHSKRMKEYFNLNPDLKEKYRQSSLLQHKINPNFGMHGKHHSIETKQKISEKKKGMKSNMEGLKEYYKTHDPWNIGNKKYSFNCKECGKEIRTSYKNLKFCSSKCVAEFRKEELREWRRNQILPTKDTSIEVKIQNFLKELHIEFLTHQYIHIEHGYQCDIFIPSMKLIIECDGCFWHGCSLCKQQINEHDIRRKTYDEIRTKELKDKGYKIIRLWEHEIKVMQLNDFKERIQ